jgi:hypothetical protein
MDRIRSFVLGRKFSDHVKVLEQQGSQIDAYQKDLFVNKPFYDDFTFEDLLSPKLMTRKFLLSHDLSMATEDDSGISMYAYQLFRRIPGAIEQIQEFVIKRKSETVYDT